MACVAETQSWRLYAYISPQTQHWIDLLYLVVLDATHQQWCSAYDLSTSTTIAALISTTVVGCHLDRPFACQACALNQAGVTC